MPDIRLVSTVTPALLTFDWLQTPTGLIDETQQLADAVLLALNSDATADESEALPDPRDDNRRGWWGDLDAEAIWNGWPLGSKLWLLRRAKIVDRSAAEGSTTMRADKYIRAALQPFVDAGVCSKFTVNVQQVDEKHITASIVIYRGPKPAIRLEYQPIWQELFPGS